GRARPYVSACGRYPTGPPLRNRASSLRSRNTGRKERRSAKVPERQPCSMLHSPGSRRLLGRLVGVRRHLGAGHELIIKRYHSRKPTAAASAPNIACAVFIRQGYPRPTPYPGGGLRAST